jgi:hypothetical protein
MTVPSAKTVVRIRSAGPLSASYLDSWPDDDLALDFEKAQLSNASAATTFQVYLLHSWRFGANEVAWSIDKLAAAPLKAIFHKENVLVWGQCAAYSSLRRKKRRSESGDSSPEARLESVQLCHAVPIFFELMMGAGYLAVPLHPTLKSTDNTSTKVREVGPLSN